MRSHLIHSEVHTIHDNSIQWFTETSKSYEKPSMEQSWMTNGAGYHKKGYSKKFRFDTRNTYRNIEQNLTQGR